MSGEGREVNVFERVALVVWDQWVAIVKWCHDFTRPKPGFDPRSIEVRRLEDWPVYTHISGVTKYPGLFSYAGRYLIALVTGIVALPVLAVACVFFVLGLILRLIVIALSGVINRSLS